CLGNRLRAADFADAAAGFIAEAAGHFDLAELTGMQELHGLLQPFGAAALRARLTNTVIFAGRLHDTPAFAHIMAYRLFHVDVFAGLHGPNRHECVPVIGRGRSDDVDGLVIEYSAKVLLRL